jgi:mannan endo-1,4-beta-mannosidase
MEIRKCPGPSVHYDTLAQFRRPSNTLRLLLSLLVLLLLTAATPAQNDMKHFITRSGNKLMEGDKEYRFISFNIPNLHVIEDNMAFDATNEWRFPDEFEITDALMTVKAMGGRVTRTYVLSICRKDGPNPIPCHIKRPGEFNEEAFVALDKVLEVAGRAGIRVIIPLVDNWKWWGGIEQYAEYRGKSPAEFWTDRGVVEDFKKTVDFVINRRNTLTGKLYKEDKAILAWETGNELYSPYQWTREIAAHIKSLDANHLVLDGFYIGAKEIQPEALDDPNIDIVSSHHYPGPNKGAPEMAADIVRFREQIGGKKAYIEGEVGFIPVAGMEHVLNTVISNGLSGAMGWSLRSHNRDGGFYWHSEPSGGGLYKAYHYPGFATGDAYEESALLKLIRAKAYEIRGLPVPPQDIPAAPKLLAARSVAAISWQGSVGASGYDVERATSSKGPWTVVAMNVDDTWTQYRSLFADATAKPGNSYYYRVLAKNPAGKSRPSNVIGPISVDVFTLIDELSDFSRMFAHGEGASIATANARAYKEDAHRVKGSEGSWISYRVPATLVSVRVFVFMEGSEKPLEFSVSADGKRFTKVEPRVSRFPTEVNPYGYKLPIQYDLAGVAGGNHVLKILFTGEAQISRVELQHGK